MSSNKKTSKKTAAYINIIPSELDQALGEPLPRNVLL
jgi:hypothetical protein